uniref:Protein kinase domain-containing protein n=1 Tax=Gongylonema pulchrum TaxID=637853 RepID=A0A183E1A8_9BILA
LNGLQLLHDNGIAHLSLDLRSVWLTTKRNFRLSDYFLRALVLELCNTFTLCKDTAGESVSQQCDRNPRNDLVTLGGIFEEFKTFSSVAANCGFLKNLSNFIDSCRNAKTVKDLLEHPFLRQDDLFASLLPSVGFGDGLQQVTHSRFQDEFVFVEMLGKGGFGDVLLAKNKLDGNDYAIKRIPLDPKDERFSRKVTREAKLFSKLNHPNVVRYYSAWIDHQPVTKPRQSSEHDRKSTGNGQKEESGDESDSLMPLQVRNIEKMANRLAVDATSEWSTSFQPTASRVHEQVSEEVRRVPVETLFSAGAPSAIESSDFVLLEIYFSLQATFGKGVVEVLFEDGGDNESCDDDEDDGNDEASTSPTESHVETSSSSGLRILYIQMEYCEKSTLRNLIDSTKLLRNPRQAWRLFREILLGLQYIHQEGMIHRDIKPVGFVFFEEMNILIDGNDHAKIGDFGLATREMVSKNLGIVLFEMFYRPLLPGMERIATIKVLRSCAHFPSDFASGLLEKLIKWMLELQPEDRPSVQNLLDSDRVPVVEIEENDFQV